MREERSAKVHITLIDRARELDKKTATEHVLTAVTVSLNAVPGVGGVLASVLEYYGPDRARERVQRFAEELAKDLTEVSDRIKKDYVRTDEFCFLMGESFRTVVREYQEEKLRAYRRILVNAITVDVPAAIQESYLNRIQNMTALHIRVLSIFRNVEEKDMVKPSTHNQPKGSIRLAVMEVLPDLPEDAVKACLHDLYTMGFIMDDGEQWFTIVKDPGMPRLGDFLTPHGREFLSFIN